MSVTYLLLFWVSLIYCYAECHFFIVILSVIYCYAECHFLLILLVSLIYCYGVCQFFIVVMSVIYCYTQYHFVLIHFVTYLLLWCVPVFHCCDECHLLLYWDRRRQFFPLYSIFFIFFLSIFLFVILFNWWSFVRTLSQQEIGRNAKRHFSILVKSKL